MDHFFSAAGYGNFLLVIFVIVLVHELGHYWVARMCGVRVLVFSVGFGKEICGFTDRHGTRWKLSLLPFGGYVKMQDEPSPSPSPDSATEPSPLLSDSGSFNNKALWQKTLVVAAGPAANYIYAVLVLAAMFIFAGQPQTADYRTSGIGAVLDGTPAHTAGLQAGDVITRINDTPINDFTELAEQVTKKGEGGEALTLEIFRGGEDRGEGFTTIVTPQAIEQQGRIYYRLGIARPAPQYVLLSPIDALGQGVQSVADWTVLIVRSLGGMIVGAVSLDELGGPVRIAQISKDAGSGGAYNWLYLTVILSVNLGFINLLPLPLTDGMHLTLYGLQAVRRRPLSQAAQDIIMRYGFVFIIALMLLITFNDIRQIAF